MVHLKKINLGYSQKNIPIPPNDSYLKALIAKTEHFIKRLRWKIFHFENASVEDKPDEDNKTYGFRTTKTPPQNPALNQFEDDVYDLISNVEFRVVKSEFQNTLKKDISGIKDSNKVILPADKTTNLYQVSSQDYNKLLQDSITQEYKKAPEGTKNNIDKDALSLVNPLNLTSRIEAYTSNPSFITIKDHKINFESAPSCRLINPAKSDIGKISKQILEKLVKDVNSKLNYNLWKSTSNVTNWFIHLTQKSRARFVQFDIESFYPSITEKLLDKALEFATNLCPISKTHMDIIKQARKSILFSADTCWVKRSGNLFDVTMGSYDGAETCELVGLYLLHKLSKITPVANTGLYRDDGLIAVQCTSGRKMDLIRKNLHKCFKDEGLKIVVETNVKKANFLDVTLDLEDGTFRPYRKPNDTPRYIHKDSNHPPALIKNLQPMINRRLNAISCNKTAFDESKQLYQDALQKSGHNQPLQWMGNDPVDGTMNQTHGKVKKSRSRKIIWFNPPYSQSVKTNIGKEFFRILEKHFPKRHKFHKLFNKNTVKLSYSCMPNVGSLIKSHNMKTLNGKETQSTPSCNCRAKGECPLDGKCCSKSIVYQATISDSQNQFHYIGISEPEFKSRFSGHKSSMKNRTYEHSTELSKKYWQMRDLGITPSVTWKILQKAQPLQSGKVNCDLCLSEKLQIAKFRDKNLLNKKTEFISKCRHKLKYMLEKVS